MSGLLPQPLVFSNRGIQLTQCQHFFMYVCVSALSSFLCSPIYISPCNCVEHGKWDLPKWVSAFRDFSSSLNIGFLYTLRGAAGDTRCSYHLWTSYWLGREWIKSPHLPTLDYQTFHTILCITDEAIWDIRMVCVFKNDFKPWAVYTVSFSSATVS